MHTLILIPLIIIFASCSFSSSSDEEAAVGERTQRIEVLSPDSDADGDFLTYEQELKRGTNPEIADIPKLKLFLNHKLRVILEYSDGEGEKNFHFDHWFSKTQEDLGLSGYPCFKEELLELAAKKATLPNHSKGTLSSSDIFSLCFKQLSLDEIQRRELDIFNLKINSISNVWLSFNLGFLLEMDSSTKAISDIHYQVFYIDPETKKEIILKEDTLFETLSIGDFKTEKVMFSMSDSYLKSILLKTGELPRLRIVDYEIPERKTSLKNLIRKVRTHTTTLIRLLPESFESFFVAVAKSDKSNLISHMTKAFGESFNFNENALESLGQYANTLTFESDEGEVGLRHGVDTFNQGRWYLFSQKDQLRPLLRESFKVGEVIALSYFLGSELARVKNCHSKTVEENGLTLTNHQLSLGNLSKNSSLTLSFKGNLLKGTRPNVTSKTHSTDLPCSGNCSSPRNTCTIELTTYEDVFESFRFKNDFLKQMVFHFKNQKIPLIDLFNGGFLKVTNDQNTFTLRLDRLYDQLASFLETRNLEISSIPVDSNLITLEIQEELIESYEGLRLISAVGDSPMFCVIGMVENARVGNIPVNTHSLEFSAWSPSVNWNVINSAGQRLSTLKTNYHLTSTLTNYFN